jgi:hypothetical protein
MKAHKSVDDALDKGDVMRSYDAIAELINDELSEKPVTRKLCFDAGFAAYSGGRLQFRRRSAKYGLLPSSRRATSVGVMAAGPQGCGLLSRCTNATWPKPPGACVITSGGFRG